MDLVFVSGFNSYILYYKGEDTFYEPVVVPKISGNDDQGAVSISLYDIDQDGSLDLIISYTVVQPKLI